MTHNMFFQVLGAEANKVRLIAIKSFSEIRCVVPNLSTHTNPHVIGIYRTVYTTIRNGYGRSLGSLLIDLEQYP